MISPVLGSPNVIDLITPIKPRHHLRPANTCFHTPVSRAIFVQTSYRCATWLLRPDFSREICCHSAGASRLLHGRPLKRAKATNKLFLLLCFHSPPPQSTPTTSSRVLFFWKLKNSQSVPTICHSRVYEKYRALASIQIKAQFRCPRNHTRRARRRSYSPNASRPFSNPTSLRTSIRHSSRPSRGSCSRMRLGSPSAPSALNALWPPRYGPYRPPQLRIRAGGNDAHGEVTRTTGQKRRTRVVKMASRPGRERARSSGLCRLRRPQSLSLWPVRDGRGA